MIDVVQGSPEWLALRAGKVTASRVCDVVARTKTGWGSSRANYMAELICERLTGQPSPTFTNASMVWGTQMEPSARAAYEFRFNCDVAQVGFVPHPQIEMSGASPDGLVGGDGLLEIKCPQSATHIDTLLNGKVPEKYVTQMQWQMACTGRQWCDFVSYDPRLPPSMQMFVRRVAIDTVLISDLETMVRDFLAEVDAKVIALRNQYEQREAAE